MAHEAQRPEDAEEPGAPGSAEAAGAPAAGVGGAQHHPPMGLEMDGLGTGDVVAEQEREQHRALPAVFRWLDTVLKTLMAAFLVILLVAVGANVFGRFVLNQSLAVTDELARYLFIWVIFLGAALAHLHREHIAVTLLPDKFPAGAQRWITLLQELLILVVVVALLLSAREVFATAPGSSALLRIPLSWVNVAVPVCAALMGLITLYRIAETFRSPRGTKG